MASRPKKKSSVRTHFLSPFRNIFKPRTEDFNKKPITINILSSYIRYKNNPLSGNLKQNLKSFIKSYKGRESNTSVFNPMKNFMETKRANTRNYKIIKKHNIRDKNRNTTNRIYHSCSSGTSVKKEKYNNRYKYLMSNLSYNGNSSCASFKNISNNILDGIFKSKPFVSYDETKIKVVNKAPKKYKLFFHNISNQSKESNYSKEQDFSPIKRKLNIRKDNDINKRISFENKILNKLSEQNEFDDAYSERDYNTNIHSKYLEFKLNKEDTKERRKVEHNEFYKDFKNFKQKLNKQIEVNDEIIKDIKRQQSLNKYNIQVGIVKLNGYKVKLRQLKKAQSVAQ